MSTIENIDELPLHLRGNWAPIAEERTITDLQVTGTIPAELDGRYVRNGANPITGFSDHPFLGDGMIHGIRLRGGKAEWYRNRYVQTPFISTPERPVIDVNDSFTDMAASKANTNVVGHAGKILALEEGHFPYVLDGNLDTVGPTDYDGKLKGSFTAHPKLCPVNGELVGFGYSLFAPYLTYLRVSAAGELVQSENITVGGPTMMHDFNMTQNHVIFMDLPAVFDMDMAMRGEMPYHTSFGDGGEFGVAQLHAIRAAQWANSVSWDYAEGDLLVLDNYRAMHGRFGWEAGAPREMLMAMVGDDGEAAEAARAAEGEGEGAGVPPQGPGAGPGARGGVMGGDD